MIQDIYPSKLDNSFIDRRPSPEDPLLLLDEKGRLLAEITLKQIRFPPITIAFRKVSKSI